jgi:hypothetical protein
MHRIKEKGLYMMFIGTICTGACLAPRKRVRIHGLHGVVPQAAAIVSFSCGIPPTKMDLHAMMMHVLFKLNDSIKDSI